MNSVQTRIFFKLAHYNLIHNEDGNIVVRDLIRNEMDIDQLSNSLLDNIEAELNDSV